MKQSGQDMRWVLKMVLYWSGLGNIWELEWEKKLGIGSCQGEKSLGLEVVTKTKGKPQVFVRECTATSAEAFSHLATNTRSKVARLILNSLWRWCPLKSHRVVSALISIRNEWSRTPRCKSSVPEPRPAYTGPQSHWLNELYIEV